MNSPILAWLIENYQWKLSLIAMGGIIAVTVVLHQLAMLVPTFKAAHQLNVSTYKSKREKPAYVANQKWNRPWALLFQVIIFGGVLPFCLTAAPQPWWRLPVDIFVILMVYDFVYYLTHRYLFHNSGFLNGPLLWMHAVHHQQKNPCRNDSGYIHPLETAIGLGLYVGTIFVLSRFMGSFHVVTIIVTFVTFTQLNLHNHDLWTVDRFPFKWAAYFSRMHHHHHAKFTGGNFATITLLYDWMFGTLDHGEGGKSKAGVTRRDEVAAEA